MSARKQVEVDVEYRLSGIGVGVLHDAEPPLVHPTLPGNGGGSPEDAPNEGIIPWAKVKGIHDVLAGNEQNMVQRNRVYVFDSNEVVVLVDLPCGDGPVDDLTEDAVVHPVFLSCRFGFDSRGRPP